MQHGQKSCCCCCSWFPLSFICCQTSKQDLFYKRSQAFQPLSLPVLLHCGAAAAPGDSKLRCFTHQPGSKHLCKAELGSTTPQAFPSHSMDFQSSVSLKFNNPITEQSQGIVSHNTAHVGHAEMSEQVVYE